MLRDKGAAREDLMAKPLLSILAHQILLKIKLWYLIVYFLTINSCDLAMALLIQRQASYAYFISVKYI